MNSYLTIAAAVLRDAKQPLSAQQILKIAFSRQIVPEQLYGKTQYKTLHARIAEEISKNKLRSEFIRTSPGRFYLRRLIGTTGGRNSSLREFIAPPRSDQLKNFQVLCIQNERVKRICDFHGNVTSIRNISEYDLKYYKLSSKQMKGEVALKIFVIIKTSNGVFVHKHNRSYISELDNVQSLGVIGYIKLEDRTLFSSDPFGLTEAASRVMSEQLYFPYELLDDLVAEVAPTDAKFIIADSHGDLPQAVAILVVYKCPESLKEYIDRLAGSSWEAHLTTRNTYLGFDVLSQAVFKYKPELLEPEMLTSTDLSGA